MELEKKLKSYRAQKRREVFVANVVGRFKKMMTALVGGIVPKEDAKKDHVINIEVSNPLQYFNSLTVFLLFLLYFRPQTMKEIKQTTINRIYHKKSPQSENYGHRFCHPPKKKVSLVKKTKRKSMIPYNPGPG